MRRILVIVMLILPLLAFGVWIVIRARRPLPQSPSAPCVTASQRPPQLPAPSSCGAVGRSPLEHFNRSTIYMWLDGGAEPYLQHGFARSTLATYQFNSGTTDVTIEAAAVRFTSPAGAKAQATAEAPPGAKPVPGLAGAVTGSGVLVLQHRCDMLHLVSFTPHIDATPQLIALATSWLHGRR